MFICTLGGTINNSSFRKVTDIKLYEENLGDFTIKFSEPSNMMSNDKIVLYYDGKIFGKTLKDLFLFYKKYGNKFNKFINGEYRLILFDSIKSELILVTDSRSTRKTYFTKNNKCWYASSHIKPLLSIIKNYSLNKKSLIEFLSFGTVVSPNTMFNEITQLKPNEMVQLNNSENKHEMYKIQFAKPPLSNTMLIKNFILKTYRDCVADRIYEIENVGVPLSGGIDSSIITILAAQNKKNVHTYTLSYDNEELNEVYYAKMLSDGLGIENKEVYINSNIIYKSPLTVWIEESPHQSVRAFLNMKLAEATKKDEAVLIGEGVESSFIYGKDFKAISVLSKIIGRKKFYNPINFWLDIRGIRKFYRFIDKDTLKNLIGDFRNQKLFNQYNLLKHRLWDIEYIPLIQKYHDLQKSESFYPFIDDRVMGFYCIPQILRQDKKILKFTFKKYLPESIIKRKKILLTSPSKPWLSEQSEIINTFLRRFYERNLIEKKLTCVYLNSKFPHSDRRKWSIFFLEIFMETFFGDKKLIKPRNPNKFFN
jgi:asparagine synthetase B (glutamine-hydrolysing)